MVAREIPSLQDIHDTVREMLGYAADSKRLGIGSERLDLIAARLCEDIDDYIRSEVIRAGEKITLPEQAVQAEDSNGNAVTVNPGSRPRTRLHPRMGKDTRLTQ